MSRAVPKTWPNKGSVPFYVAPCIYDQKNNLDSHNIAGNTPNTKEEEMIFSGNAPTTNIRQTKKQQRETNTKTNAA